MVASGRGVSLGGRAVAYRRLSVTGPKGLKGTRGKGIRKTPDWGRRALHLL